MRDTALHAGVDFNHSYRHQPSEKLSRIFKAVCTHHDLSPATGAHYATRLVKPSPTSLATKTTGHRRPCCSSSSRTVASTCDFTVVLGSPPPPLLSLHLPLCLCWSLLSLLEASPFRTSPMSMVKVKIKMLPTIDVYVVHRSIRHVNHLTLSSHSHRLLTHRAVGSTLIRSSMTMMSTPTYKKDVVQCILLQQCSLFPTCFSIFFWVLYFSGCQFMLLQNTMHLCFHSTSLHV